MPQFETMPCLRKLQKEKYLLTRFSNSVSRATGTIIDMRKFLHRRPEWINKCLFDRDQWNALHICSSEGYLNKVKWLLGRKGIEVNARDKYEYRPIELAICRDHYACVVELLAKGADIDINTRSIRKPYKDLIAAEYKRRNVFAVDTHSGSSKTKKELIAAEYKRRNLFATNTHSAPLTNASLKDTCRNHTNAHGKRAKDDEEHASMIPYSAPNSKFASLKIQKSRPKTRIVMPNKHAWSVEEIEEQVQTKKEQVEQVQVISVGSSPVQSAAASPNICQGSDMLNSVSKPANAKAWGGSKHDNDPIRAAAASHPAPQPNVSNKTEKTKKRTVSRRHRTRSRKSTMKLKIASTKSSERLDLKIESLPMNKAVPRRRRRRARSPGRSRKSPLKFNVSSRKSTGNLALDIESQPVTRGFLQELKAKSLRPRTATRRTRRVIGKQNRK